MLRWLRCLFGRHESNDLLYPLDWHDHIAVSKCLHCDAVVEHRLGEWEFNLLFLPGKVRVRLSGKGTNS